MPYLYFSCEWLVLYPKIATRWTGKELFDIYEIVTEMDCWLIVGVWTTWRIQADGCRVIPCLIGVANRESLQTFLGGLNNYMQFSNIQPATSEYDLEGDPDMFALSAGRTGIIDIIQEMAENNERIIQDRN